MSKSLNEARMPSLSDKLDAQEEARNAVPVVPEAKEPKAKGRPLSTKKK